MYIRSFFICSLLLLSCGLSHAQQELSLYFLQEAMPARMQNPAFMTEKKIQIGLPSPFVSAQHDGFAWKNLIRPMAGTDSFLVDPDYALMNMKDRNRLQAHAAMDLLGFSIRLGGLQLSLNTATRSQVSFTYPKDLLEITWHGNAPFMGENLDLAPGIQAYAYHEIGLGAAFRIKDKLSLGIRPKYLIGLASFSTQRQQLSLQTNPETYALGLDLDYSLRTSMVQLGSLEDLENLQPSFEPQPFTSNRGWAIDLGMDWKVLEKLRVSASVRDLGFLNWNEQTTTYRASGQLSFEGFDAARMLSDSQAIESFKDSMLQQIQLDEESSAGFRTVLPGTASVSLIFSPIKSFRVGGLYQATWYDGKTASALALNASKDLGKVFTAGLTYAIQNRSYTNLGLNLWLKLGPFAGFIASDNVLAPLLPRSSRQVNLRIGSQILF
ncbi:MAG: DUF5723 family protein [Bacteroidota bacterium]